MIRATLIHKALCAAAMTLALATTANATAVRTFVSGTGNDGNNCSRLSPCRTLAVALVATTPGGEIYALDPAGYGPITISGPISLIGVRGAAIAVASGTTGVTIATGSPTDRVFISGFIISGAGASNTTGISVTQGLLSLDQSVLKLLNIGLSVTNTRVDLTHVDINTNGTGIATNGAGVNTNNFSDLGSPLTLVRMAYGSLIGNTVGVNQTNPGTGSGATRATVMPFAGSNTNSFGGILTDIAGNATLITGTGAGCPCTTFQSSYNGAQNFP